MNLNKPCQEQKPIILEVQNLHVSTKGNQILNGVNLKVFAGEIHAIMGPNGSGKSTFAKALAGHPAYLKTEGKILFEEADISDLEPDERSRLGLFLGFQYPVEIPGVDFYSFFDALNTLHCERRYGSDSDWYTWRDKQQKLLNIDDQEFSQRSLNEGFSGGEKKKYEIYQYALVNAQLGILDEIDSGLDIDALQKLSLAINNILKEDRTKSIILITHYKRLLEYIKPDFVHIFKDGKIVETGDIELVNKLEEKGYE